MLSYLEKFHKLPQDLQDLVSSDESMAVITEIEGKYSINLASVVMKVMVKDVAILDLGKLLKFEYGIDDSSASSIVEELTDKIFIRAADHLELTRPLPSVAAPVPVDDYLTQKQEETAARSPAFFFSSEDEEEIKNLTQKIGAVEPSSAPANLEIEKKMTKIMAETQLTFGSAELGERFKKIMDTYLRGVRKKIEAKQALAKPIDFGGLGFEMAQVDKIFTVADRINGAPAEIKPADQAKATPAIGAQDIDDLISKLKTSGVRDLDYDFSSLGRKKEPVLEKPAQPTEIITEKTELAPPPTAAGAAASPPPIPVLDLKTPTMAQANETVRETEKSFEFLTDLKLDKISPADTARPDVRELPALDLASRRQMANGNGAGKMQDVKFVPKLTGPVDELADMDLTNFRRLNTDARSAAASIKEKINFLEEDNYAQRLAGIKAWRQSPLNALYLELGQASITNKKNIEDIIKAKQDKGESTMSINEFNAIMDLNKSLRF